MVDSQLFSSTLQFTLTTLFKILESLDTSQWAFGNSIVLSLVTILGVITSLLNHGFTHSAFVWMDRVTIVCLVFMTLVPTIWTEDFHMIHAWVFLGCLSFVWSKINVDDDFTRTVAHQASHRMAA